MVVRRSSVDFARKCIWVKAAINQRDLHTPKYHRVKRPIRISDADLERLKRFMAKRPDDGPDVGAVFQTLATEAEEEREGNRSYSAAGGWGRHVLPKSHAKHVRFTRSS
jgi:hypothetical protein